MSAQRTVTARVFILTGFVWICLSTALCQTHVADANLLTRVGELYPLSIGDTWSYDQYLLDTSGVRILGTEKPVRYTIVDTTTRNGLHAWVRRWEVRREDGRETTGVEYVACAPNGDIMWQSDSSEGNQANVWKLNIPFGLLSGMDVSGDTSFRDTTVTMRMTDELTRFRTTYIAANVQVEVPGGKFNTLKIGVQDSTITRYLAREHAAMSITGILIERYYAPHVGLVQYSAESPPRGATKNIRTMKVLKSFKVR